MAVIWIDEQTILERRTFKVYQFGLYVGTMILTPAEVLEITAKAVYVLKPMF